MAKTQNKIKLVSTARKANGALTGYYYTTVKNKKNTPEKMERKKYDPIVRKTVVFKEDKIK